MNETLLKKSEMTVIIFGVSMPRYIDCKNCKAKLACEWQLYGYQTICSDCQIKEYEKEKHKSNFSIQTMKDATAIGIDTNTGRPVALDTKGKKIPLERTAYKSVDNLRQDPHAWKTMQRGKYKRR